MNTLDTKNFMFNFHMLWSWGNNMVVADKHSCWRWENNNSEYRPFCRKNKERSV